MAAPVCMFNALWFTADGGLERYLEYGAAVQPVLADVGAEVVVPFRPVERCLEGEVDADLVGVVRYPSSDAFEAMVASDDYQRIAHLRTEAITKAMLTPCDVEPADAPAMAIDGGIAVLNALWFHPGGAERYDEYLEAARPLVEDLGGRFLTPRFRPRHAGLGEPFGPDLLFFGHYPSTEALFALVGDERYTSGPMTIRTEAVARSATTILRIG